MLFAPLPGLRLAAWLSVAYLASSASSLGILDAIPQCYQDCIKNTGDFTCNGIDIQCLCRLSKGNFLTDVISCMRSNCDNNLNVTSLIRPVVALCAENGVTVASAAVASAQSIASSMAATRSTPSFTGATTITTTFASAGTMYVLAMPLSVTSGSSGLRTVTATPSTIIAASINGGTARASSTTAATSFNSSSVVTPAPTNPTSAGSATTESLSSSTGRPQNGGNGSPFSNDANLPMQLRCTWLASSMILVVFGMMWFI